MRIFVLAFLMSGCTATKREAPYTTTDVPTDKAGGFECSAEPVQYALGRKTSTALAQQLMAEAGAEILRWIPPRTAVTMDFSSVRLNISYDDNMIINRINCG